jgi:acetyl esterase
MPMEDIYLKKRHLIADALAGDWMALQPFFADDEPYAGRPVTIENVVIPGEVDIPARVYTPSAGVPAYAPALVWFHGGAFKGGDLDMGESHFLSSEIAHLGNMVVVTVDYRLCNDGVTFPAPQEDGVAAIAWVQENRTRLGIGGGIYAGGASAGACLTGSAVQILRDRGLEQVAGALLIYPVTHSGTWEFSDWQKERLAELPPTIGFPDEWRKGLNAEVMGKPLDQSTGHDFPGDATNFGDLPSHLIVNCEYDDLAPSGEKYALDLAHAGVKVTQYTELGVLHGHLNKNPKEVAGARNTIKNMIEFMGAN